MSIECGRLFIIRITWVPINAVPVSIIWLKMRYILHEVFCTVMVPWRNKMVYRRANFYCLLSFYLKIKVCCVVALCQLVNSSWHFRGAYFLLRQGVSGQQDTCALRPVAGYTHTHTHSVTYPVAWIFISTACRTAEMSHKFACILIQVKNIFSYAFCVL